MTSLLIEPATAAYLHIPFCVRKCAYCDFASYAGCLDQIPAYVDALVKEIMITADKVKGQPLTSVFFGGGTPSLLPPRMIDRLLTELAGAFGFSETVEITIEANPGTIGQSQLLDYRKSGCNRISIGVQSMQPPVLKLLGRIHSPEEAREAIRLADAAGFSRISADLMFGLPEQSVTDVAKSVQVMLELPVSHISFYSLSLEPGTAFYEHYDRHPEKLPNDETERSQYETVRNLTATAGMTHYEISNTAFPGEECRHNLTYWQARPYFGFGAGAHSYLEGVRRGNVPLIDGYIDRITTQDQPFAAAESSELLTISQQEQEFMLLGLRLLDGVDAGSFRSRFGGDLFVRFAKELETLTVRGLIERRGSRVLLTRLGLDFANQVFMEFV